MSNPKKLRVAVLGAGAAAERYYFPALRTWHHQLALVGLCDTSPERREQIGQAFDCDALYDDYGQMLANCACDAVAILTPHADHAAQCKQALDAGRHVMIEKPLALTTSDAVGLADLAEAKNLVISCAPPTMLHPGQRRLKELLEKGAIGKVCLVRITRSGMGPGSQPGAPTDTSWFYRKGAGGLSSMAGYGLAMATGALGPVRSLQAMSCTSLPQRTIRSGPANGEIVDVDVPDNNVMLFNFGDQLLGTMDSGYCTMATRGPSMELFGSEGVICVWGGDMPTRLEIYQDDWATDVAGWRDVPVPGLQSAWAAHPATLLHLAEVVLEGKKLLTGPRHMAHIVEIMEKTWEAADTGREVELETTFAPCASTDLPLIREIPPIPQLP